MANAPKAIFDCDEALRAHSHRPSSYIMAGIVGDTQHSFGYHLAPHELPSDDYSLELARDKAGAKKNRGMASAWDLHSVPRT